MTGAQFEIRIESFQPTVIFLDEAGNRHVPRQGADEKGRPEKVGGPKRWD